jgi:DNA-binding GntR family transcriptional regulator
MSDDTLIDRAGPVRAYQQVADAVAARIGAGRYPGQLPAERDLAREFGVSYVTVRRAMAVLRERGLIETIRGRGTFTAPGSAGNPARPAIPQGATGARPRTERRESAAD